MRPYLENTHCKKWLACLASMRPWVQTPVPPKKKKNGMWMKKMLWFKAGKRVIVCMIWMKVHPPKFTLKFHLQWNIRDVAFGRWLSHEGCAFYPFLHVRTQCCSSPENAAKRGHLRSRHNPHHPHQCFDLRIPSLQND
jgi:hypothetical protein